MSLPQTYEELLAELDGVSPEEYRRDASLRERLGQAGEKYRRKPPSDWPSLKFNWDLRPESQCYTLDGVKPSEFSSHYPNGFILGYVSIKEFDEVLCHFNRRNLSELWDCGFESSLCYIIAYLEEGLPITPPLAAVTPSNEICLHGGNHRYTAAKFSGLDTIPIYIDPEHKAGLSKLVPVSWSEA